MDPTRRNDLKAMLEERLKEAQRGVSDRVREIRTTSRREQRDGLTDASGSGLQDEIEVALLQMNADLAGKIKSALARLEAGRYGQCRECGEDIPAARLRALPFAARCKPCQEGVDTAERRERRMEQHALGTLLSRLTEATERNGW
jgi:DnaK suppressor protein